MHLLPGLEGGGGGGVEVNGCVDAVRYAVVCCMHNRESHLWPR